MGLKNGIAPSFFPSFFPKFSFHSALVSTGVMMYRNPCEMGGLYFSVNAIMSQVILWGSIKLYIDEMGGGEENADVNSGKLTNEMLCSIGQFISSVWLVSVAAFLMVCKKEYIRGFYGTLSTKTYTKECWDWQISQDPRVADEVIVKLSKKHRDAYKHFEDEVGAFVSANWEKWNHEKPKFINKKFIASIPFTVLSKEIREEVMIDEND
jgi:hypothetical protein